MSSSRKSQEGKGGKKASPVYPAYKRMAGKVALVTGAGSGIGRGIAMKFASEGAKLALLDINQAGMDETIALIKKDINKDVEALAIKTDVTSEAAVVSAVSTTTSKLGGLDVMMCNAGKESDLGPRTMPKPIILAKFYPQATWHLLKKKIDKGAFSSFFLLDSSYVCFFLLLLV